MENGTAANAQSDGKDPSGFLSEIIGNPVTVRLNSGVVYKGKLPDLPNSQGSGSPFMFPVPIV